MPDLETPKIDSPKNDYKFIIGIVIFLVVLTIFSIVTNIKAMTALDQNVLEDATTERLEKQLKTASTELEEKIKKQEQMLLEYNAAHASIGENLQKIGERFDKNDLNDSALATVLTQFQTDANSKFENINTVDVKLATLLQKDQSRLADVETELTILPNKLDSATQNINDKISALNTSVSDMQAQLAVISSIVNPRQPQPLV